MASWDLTDFSMATWLLTFLIWTITLCAQNGRVYSLLSGWATSPR